MFSLNFSSTPDPDARRREGHIHIEFGGTSSSCLRSLNRLTLYSRQLQTLIAMDDWTCWMYSQTYSAIPLYISTPPGLMERVNVMHVNISLAEAFAR
jgi:hypothetical protein